MLFIWTGFRLQGLYGILDYSAPLLPIFVVIMRIILIITAIEGYREFILPKRLKDLILKQTSRK